MSSYLKTLLKDKKQSSSSKQPSKQLPSWLASVQSSRPVTYDTSEMYEDKGDEMERKRQLQQQIYSKKCYECDEFGHIAKECPNKWKKKLGGRFKDSDWCCSMCGNINWDWRTHCNKCSTPKPSGSVNEKRTGKGGGYNEIDEETMKRLKEKKNSNINKKNTNKQTNNNEITINITEKPKLNSSETYGNPTIYICGLNNDKINIKEIVKHFGQIGRIKKDRKGGYCVKLYKNEDGEYCGDGVVTYEDAHAAPFAVQWFNKTTFLGSEISVQLSVSKVKKDKIGKKNSGNKVNLLESNVKGDDFSGDESGSGMDEDDDDDDDDLFCAQLFGYSKRGRSKRFSNRYHNYRR